MKFDRRVRTVIETNFVLINPYTRYWRSLIRSLESGPLPKPYYRVLQRDRSRPVYFDEVDLEEKREKRLRGAVFQHELTPRLSPERWLENARRLEPAVAAIRARGGTSCSSGCRPPGVTGSSTSRTTRALSTGIGLPRARALRQFISGTSPA